MYVLEGVCVREKEGECATEKGLEGKKESERRMCKLFCCNFEIKELLLCAGFIMSVGLCVIDNI